MLTDRDADILEAVHLHGLLSVELLEMAFFPPPASGRVAPSTNAYRRLRQLWLWGHIRRVEKPVARALGGSEPHLYALGGPGVPLVVARLGVERERVRTRRLDRLNPQFWDHDLRAALLWALLRSALCGSPSSRDSAAQPVSTGFHGESERALRARAIRFRDSSGRPLPFVPDGYFAVRYGGTGPGGDGARAAVQCCVVEIDTGSLTLRRFRRKLLAFEQALSSGRFGEEWKRPEFEAVVVTGSEARLRHLWAAARDVVPAHRWGWYSLGTLDLLQSHRFGGHEWLTLEGERVRLLYDSAYVQAELADVVRSSGEPEYLSPMTTPTCRRC